MEKRLRTKFIQYDDVGNLLCYKCNKYKPEEAFDNSPSNWFRNGKDRRCKDCKKQQYLKRKAANRGKKDLNRILLERYHGVLERSNKKGQECTITLDYLMKSDLDNNTFYNLCKAVYKNAAKWKH